MHWYTDVLKKYTLFTGRATRQEYWMFVLFSFLVSVALAILEGPFHSNILQNLYAVGVFLPSLAVGIRRLHDTNRSGWFSLLGLVPILGWIPLIIFLASESTPETNQYGVNPVQVDILNPESSHAVSNPEPITQEEVIINDIPLAGEKLEEKV